MLPGWEGLDVKGEPMQKRVYLDLQSLHAHRKISTEHSSWLGFDTVPTFTSMQPRSQSLTEALEFVLLPAADTGKDQQDKFANCSEVDGLQGWASERETRHSAAVSAQKPSRN